MAELIDLNPGPRLLLPFSVKAYGAYGILGKWGLLPLLKTQTVCNKPLRAGYSLLDCFFPVKLTDDIC